MPCPELPRMRMLLVVLSSARRSKSTRTLEPYLSRPIYRPWGSVLPEKLKGYKLATLDAGNTRSYCAPNWLAPTGRTERKPSFCRRVRRSTEIFERVSSMDISLWSSLSLSRLRAFSSIKTEQCKRGSLFLRRFASSSTTSWRLPWASMVSLTSLPPDMSLFFRVAFCRIFLCSIGSTSRW